ncbi:MAG: nucleotidyltransferase family protein [Methylacidiphilales bacterium]|nr:nucleotidyltransferase family protein [Candidatus Methylacidiphilales bacterium]
MKNFAPDYPALLLAGGLGTRLRSVLPELPKVLAPVRGRPFLAYLLDQLVVAGWSRCILCLGYKADVVRAAMGDCHGPLALEYSVETAPLGTAGAVRLALPLVRHKRFLLLNADSFCDASLGSFAQYHAAHGRPGSVLSVKVPDSSRYGRLEIAPDRRILAFAEKTNAAAPGPINAGIYILETALAESIPAGRFVSLEKEMFPQWTSRGLMAWETDAGFIDIGTPESYAQIERYLGAGT